MAEVRPRVFIGSSTEGKAPAEALQVLLDEDCEVKLWGPSVFELTRPYLDSLDRAARGVDAAVLVMTPDDVVESRDKQSAVPRDNVIFELGLFMGSLGPHRAFVVYDRDAGLKLPSDLAGIHCADYRRHADGDWEASLGAAATRIKKALKVLGPREGIREQLEAIKRTHSETGPAELSYLDKLAQVLQGESSKLAFVYTDIDGLRSITRKLYVAERGNSGSGDAARRTDRRLESEIRAQFLRTLHFSVTDAIYDEYPEGLKHDIFPLADPDLAVVIRKLPHDGALKVAKRIALDFKEEASRLHPEVGSPSLTTLVSHSLRLDEHLPRGAAHIHGVLRDELRRVKDAETRGEVYAL